MNMQNHTQLLDWHSPANMQALIQALGKHQVVITTTDTVPGLLGAATQESFDRLREVKQDRGEKPFLLLAADYTRALALIPKEAQSPKLISLMKQCWPGPVTLVVPTSTILPGYMRSPHHTVAVRVPDHTGLQELLTHIPYLFSTSANSSGKPTPSTLEQIEPKIAQKVPFIVSEQLTTTGLPSTIIDCTTIDCPRIIREGAYPITQLEVYYGGSFTR